MKTTKDHPSRSRLSPKPAQPKRPTVWPAYLVAACCFAIALLSTIANISLSGQLRQAQADGTQLATRSTALARQLSGVRSTLSDMLDPQSQHYRSSGDEIVVVRSRIYVVMRNLTQLPHGRVYQAWTRSRSGQRMVPSSTFLPNDRGIAVIALPVDGRSVGEVAVSVEPEGGVNQLTGKPLVDISLVTV